MSPIFAIPLMALAILRMIILVHVIMSWLISFNVVNPYQPIVAQIWNGICQLLEPVYRPIRRFIPPFGGIDLTPLVALFGVYALEYIISYYGMRF